MKSLEAGSSFAGYRIVRRIGAGGMGTMYLAHDDDLDRPVALKLLEGTVADTPDSRARFLQEAKTIAGLDHPNIVNIHARGESGDRLWIAMQYVEGSDASQLVRSGSPVAPERALQIVSDTAAALDFAHVRGILHRDVKPANILLSHSGRVLLADFGIAKELDKTGIRTSTGLVVASLQYAAPEQLDPAVRLDRRVDVYALGATLYHLLTGVPPYPGTMAQVVNGHLNAPVPVPSEYGAAPAFDAVIARAMAKRRDDRFATCGELAAAARHALQNSVPRRPVPYAGPPVVDGPTRVGTAPPHIPTPTSIRSTAHPPTWVSVPAPVEPAVRRRVPRRTWVAVAVACVATVAVAVGVLLSQSSTKSADIAAPVPGKTRLVLGGRDLGVSTDTFGPCSRIDADSAAVTASFTDGTLLAFVITVGDVSVLEVTNPADGIDLVLPPNGATVDTDGDVVTIDGQFTSRADAFSVVANCPLGN